MKATRMILALGVVGAAWGAEPKPATERLGIRYAPPPPQPAVHPIFNPPPPGVIELPRFDVQDTRARLDPEELMTDKGRLEAAKKRFISPLYAKTFGPLVQLGEYYLNFFSLLGGWHPNGDKEAMVLYDQDLRLRKMRQFDELVDLVRVTSPKEAAKLTGMRNESFRRIQPPPGSHP